MKIKFRNIKLGDIKVKLRKVKTRLENIMTKLKNIKAKLRNIKVQRSILKAYKARYLQLHLPRSCNSQVRNIKKIKHL